MLDPVFDQHDLSLLHNEIINSGTMDLTLTLMRGTLTRFFACKTANIGTHITFDEANIKLLKTQMKLKIL